MTSSSPGIVRSLGLLVLTGLAALLWPAPAHAGLLLKLPLYLGLNSGLVGFWSFNAGDMAGTMAYDWSGQGNNGTLTNEPRRVGGRIGQGLSFDGVDDYMVESACQWLIQERFKGVGMRWSEVGFDYVLHLRLAWVNGSFDALFQLRICPN
jgi:hypothetical protein